MARIRSIKPEFWTSAQVLECSTNARLLFIGLWNFCDDNGRHPASAKQVKASVFPADEIDLKSVRGMLDELSANDLIRYYMSGNVEYFYVPGWKNQRIDKPQPAKYPDPFSDHSEHIPRTLPPDRIGEDRIGKDKKKKNGLSTEYAVTSGVICLTAEDLARWEKAFSLLDVKAELESLAPWAATQKSWFNAVAGALAKRNRKVKAEQTKPKREVADYSDPEWRERHKLDGML